jgi:TRAP transporter TAXI family solute receptor
MKLKRRILISGIAAGVLGAAFSAGVAMAQDAQLRVATATSTGTFYQNGLALEVLFRDAGSSVEIFPQASGGSGENTRLARNGEVEMFFGQNSTVIPAYEGTGPFEGDPNESFSVVAAIWRSVNHFIVAKDSGIQTIEDFRGKRIQLGPVGSGIERFTQQPLEAAGITFDDVQGQRLGVAETVDMMRNGRLDGFVHAAIIPDRNAADAMTSGMAKMIPFGGAASEKLLETYPYYARTTIPANSYENQPDAIETVASYAVLYARNDVPEDVVYTVIKTIMENHDQLVTYHSSFNDTVPDVAMQGHGPVPMHPGAARYFEEIGAK